MTVQGESNRLEVPNESSADDITNLGLDINLEKFAREMKARQHQLHEKSDVLLTLCCDIQCVAKLHLPSIVVKTY